MNLQERIDADIKAAMLAREKDKLNALRAIKSAIMIELTKEAGAQMTEEAGMKILQKLHKQRSEAAAIFTQQGRADLAAEDEAQAKVIEAYLPARMSDAEMQSAVKGILEEIGAKSMADMGRAMKAVNERLAGKADGSAIAGVVKKLLSGG
jgi:uncharacterized protein